MSVESNLPDPMILKKRLRKELREVREKVGRTQKEVAAKMDWSVSKLIRIETGLVNISTNDLRYLLQYYGIDGERIENELVPMAKAAREATPWSDWKNQVSDEYLTLLGYETSAARIRNFEPTWIPGLLQTEGYAQEVLQTLETQDKERAESLVDLRMKRQELLERAAPPDLHFILDESIIRRQVGSPDIMREQLERILEFAAKPHVTVRIIGFKQGMYRNMRTPYVLLEFANDQDDDVLYFENPQGEKLITERTSTKGDKQTPADYLEHFWKLEQIAPTDRAEELIRSAMNSFE